LVPIAKAAPFAGWSQNGLVDPITGVPAYVPTVRSRGWVVDLGTFGGAFGGSTAANERGSVVGTAEKSTPDPFRLADFLNDRDLLSAPNSTELRAFGWFGEEDSCSSRIESASLP